MTRVFPLTASEREAIRNAVLKHGEHAVEQDDDWQQLAANPDLVAALGHQTADVFLGWRS